MDPMHKHARARCLRAAIVAVIALPVAAAAVAAQTVAAGRYVPTLDPKDFTSTITNPWFPLTPGTVFRYQGTGSSSDETTVTDVTSATRSVAGIPARIVHDRVFRRGELVEDTYDWYSQDNAGNVWYLGEDTKALSNGRLTNTWGSWTAGVGGAQPGIVMWGDPAAHLNSRYHQEYGHEHEHIRLGPGRSVPELCGDARHHAARAPGARAQVLLPRSRAREGGGVGRHGQSAHRRQPHGGEARSMTRSFDAPSVPVAVGRGHRWTSRQGAPDISRSVIGKSGSCPYPRLSCYAWKVYVR